MKKIIVFCGPSGSGKNTILGKVLEKIPKLMFYVSVTSRQIRGNEKNGINYYFLSSEEFKSKIENGEILEWEEVYKDTYYGTLKSELNRIWEQDKIPVSDIDVKGAMRIKDIFKENALIIFVDTPINLIKERLIARAVDSEEKIKERLSRVKEESSYKLKCDVVVENIDLDVAVEKSVQVIKVFLER